MDNKFLTACFAAYWGATVIRNEGGRSVIDAVTLSHLSEYNVWNECQLLLKPLSALNDKDAIDLIREIKAIPAMVGIVTEKSGVQILKSVIAEMGTKISAQATDYLRSKSYDCGFQNIPSLIDAGIAIDATKTNG